MHEDGTINYEGLILTIQRLESKIDRLQKQLDAIGSIEKSATDENWMTLKELQAYLPTHHQSQLYADLSHPREFLHTAPVNVFL